MIKQLPALILFFFLTNTAIASLFVEHIEENDFFSVKEDLILAITGQGLVIAHHSDVATMLNRTAKDLATQAMDIMTSFVPVPTPFKQRQPVLNNTYQHGEVIEFCSASLSADTTAADANNILLCPFSIAIYQLADEPNQVHISYLKLSRLADPDNPKSVKALKAVEDMLAEILVETVE